VKLIQQRGAEVIKLRKTSSAFSAANATKDHLRDWYFGTKQGEFVSMGIVSEGNNGYDIPSDVVYSFPVVCKPGFKVEIVKDLKLDEFSKTKMAATLAELEQEKKDAQAL